MVRYNIHAILRCYAASVVTVMWPFETELVHPSEFLSI